MIWQEMVMVYDDVTGNNRQCPSLWGFSTTFNPLGPATLGHNKADNVSA